jgi:hypothetical protein
VEILDFWCFSEGGFGGDHFYFHSFEGLMGVKMAFKKRNHLLALFNT